MCTDIAFRAPARADRSCGLRRAALLGGLCAAALLAGPTAAQEFEPFPRTTLVNDFGGVGLIQTPTARFAPDGQVFVGGNRVYPYERYFVTLQGMPWLEASLRYTSVANRLYSQVPEFSGDQSYKDRGLDLKLKIADEGRIRPAIAFGMRDFLGTGLFSSEYFVANKNIGPLDVSFGIGWGNMGSRGHVKNPFLLVSNRFRDRGEFTRGGGTVNASYFKGERVAFFGGVQYDLPVKGLTLKVEYDPNDYQSEALGNRFDVDSPVNVGLDYKVRPWLHVGASLERGNKMGVRLALTGNVHKHTRVPKFDPPAPKLRVEEAPAAGSTTPLPQVGAVAPPSREVEVISSIAPPLPVDTPPTADEREALMKALGEQGALLYAAEFEPNKVDLYVAQTRFANMATGLGRISRAAFSVLPERYEAVRIIIVEGGLETIAVTMYRFALEDALVPGRGSLDELWTRTEFEAPPLALEDAEWQTAANSRKPGFAYALRPGLRTTLGRPEQFILYQLWMRVNASLSFGRGLFATGSLGLSISDNFDKIRVGSDSRLPRVRSDIAQYLKEGKQSIQHLKLDYNFNIAPNLYGHVYGGLLEEMFAGVGGEVLYRPWDKNWAVGLDLNWVKQRDFDQLFDLRDYSVVTGHATFAYMFPASIEGKVRAGRYLAKDWGATFELSRTFRSGIVVGAFATFTDVSAAEFGEGRFDKGIYIAIPLDLIYVRNVRSGIGIGWRPLIRDGGQQLAIRNPLLGTTAVSTRGVFRRDWRDILD